MRPGDTKQSITTRMIDLHLSTEHPDDLTTTEELQQEVKALQARVDDLTVVAGRDLEGKIMDHTAPAERIRQAAKELKGRADRKG
jgi:hypothetical protein